MNAKSILLRIGGGILFIAVLTMVLYPALRPRSEEPQTSACYNQMRQSAIALTMYSADNDDFMPPSGKWMDLTLGYTQTNANFYCTKMTDPVQYGIALNSALLGFTVVPDREVPLVFDSTILARNATAGLETAPNPGRHGGYDVVGFVDTHVKAMRPEDIQGLPKPMRVKKPTDNQ